MELTGKVYFHKRPNVIMKGHREWVWSVAASKTGLVCSGSQDKHVIAWARNGAIANKFPPAAGAIVAMQFVGDILYLGCEKIVLMLNPQTGEYRDATTPCGTSLVLCLLHDGEKLFVGYSDAQVRIWQNGQVIGTLSKHKGPIKVMTKEAHALFTGSDDQSVVRFNTNTCKSTILYQGYNGPVRALVVYRNAIYFSDGNNVRAQSIETGNCLHTMTGHSKPVFSLLRQRELLISGSADCTAIIRNITTAVPICVLQAHTAVVKCMSLNGAFLYTGSSDKLVLAWDLRDPFNHVRNADALGQLVIEPPQNNNIAQRSRSATSPGMGASVAAPGGYTNMFESGNQSPATATAAYGSIPQMGNGAPTQPGAYGSMPVGNNLPPTTPQEYASIPGQPNAASGYGSVPHQNSGFAPNNASPSGYQPVNQRPIAGYSTSANGSASPGGYGQVPLPPGATDSGGYGQVPDSNWNANATARTPEPSPSLYASIPKGSIEKVDGYGVLPSAADIMAQRSASGRALNSSSPTLSAPGYAQLPTGAGMGITHNTPSTNLPPPNLTAPGYANIPTPESVARHGSGGQQVPPAPQSQPGYATRIDPRYKK